MADVNEEVLQAAAQETYGLDLPGALRRATGLNLDKNGICLRLWGKEFNEAGPEMLSVVSSHALLLPGTVGAFATTPNHASLQITGDLDLRCEFVINSYPLLNLAMVAKWNATGNQRSYLLRYTPVGNSATLFWSTAGISSLNSAFVTEFDNPGALRKTIDVVNGTDRHIDTYTAPSLDGPWTLVNHAVVAGTTSIFAGTAVASVGAQGDGSDPFFGRITRAEIRNGIDGTIVANPDFRDLAPGTTSFADSTGKTWTLQGTAVVV